ncbi:MAG: IS3 family transposase [Ignavibacteriales bacterium]|nr:IS3 family transposase [Ignavibacteriales bacterium]
MISPITDYTIKSLLTLIGISTAKFYDWRKRSGTGNRHNGKIPKGGYLLNWERKAIIDYAREHPGEGYRRLTYLMLDADVVAVSPSTTYRVLKSAGLLNRWNTVKSSKKGTGFVQPTGIHQHWHTDIKYVNFKGSFLFLISVIDGYSRYIVHHELRTNMQEIDVQITLQRALEKCEGYRPRIISDNGSQFVSKDFAAFLRFAGLEHIRTSVSYPQANGKIERYHRTIRRECFARTSMIDLDDAREQVGKFIDYYNTERLHSSLFFLTPEDFLFNRIDAKLKERNEKFLNAKLQRMKVPDYA